MKTTKKNGKALRRILIGVGALAVILIAGACLGNWWMKQPLYRFGSVRKGENLRGPLQPPPQIEPNRWRVENDISLAYETYGEGHPVIVIHGGPGMPYEKIWKGLEPLTDRYQFYFYHQRGCGDSTRPFDRFEGNFYENMIELEGTLGLGAQIADIERIRQILGQEKLTLIGHSFGGFIASLYAAEFPERVEKLVLVAPAGMLTPPDEHRDIFQQTRAKLESEQVAEFDALKMEYFDFANLFSKSDDDLAELHLKLGEYLLQAFGGEPSELNSGTTVGGWSVFALYFSVGRAQDYRPALKEIKAPTLIVQGKDDGIAMAGTKSYKPIRGSQFVLIECEDASQPAGHFVFDQAPSQFEQLIEKFLTE